ncbi:MULTISPECIES: HNH endonuclease signature motif containing protein [unclassified Mycobacterium]|uniref:HNH endonuclease signature motif containing protein n=1 Tax=unclassified Mycobacterium TaxID=2642494 RepID=UPI0029C75B40|nr:MULTISPECIES: HNH endonuclease signature motif containing protein [unclassified Mycobacterium]
MSSTAAAFAPGLSPVERLEVLFEELAELSGQRNAIDGRVVDIVAEIDRDELAGATGARSVAALVAWKTGVSPNNAHTIATVAHRLQEFPQCAQGLREGRLSLDQVGVIAERAADGSDEHYAELAAVATVSQLRTAIKLEPRPDPDPRPEPLRSITKTSDEQSATWRITLPHHEAATFDAALQSHQDKLVTAWKRDHADGASEQTPPLPGAIDGFMSLIEAGWDTEVTRRPHGQRTTVIVHVDLDAHLGALHLGPLLSDDDRQYLTCDATGEVWFQRHGQVIGSGRETRLINRRLRRALEHRDRCCVVPGCGATRGLHGHHIRHWEDGGPTELDNLVLVCPYHHRAHHRGVITITGPAQHLVVTDSEGRVLHPGSLARPPTTPPPAVPPCPGPTGERADWWWYDPFQPQPPPANN